MAESRTIVTMDADDFAAQHQIDPNHHGICAICQDNDPTKDMSFADIAQVVGEYWFSTKR